MPESRYSQGFTLIELMIVVAIIAVIAAIAIPNLLQSRIQANESAAIGNLRAICSAQSAYNASNFGFATTFEQLRGPTPPFLSGDWDGENKAGYTYSLDGSDSANFEARAEPITPGESGTRYFFVDGSNVIRFSREGSADGESQTLWSQGE